VIHHTGTTAPSVSTLLTISALLLVLLFNNGIIEWVLGAKLDSRGTFEVFIRI
jgi:hypothetical protein